MDLEKTIKSQIQTYPLGSTQRNLLRYLLGELSDRRKCHKGMSAVGALKDLIRDREEKVRRAKHPNQDLEFELETLRELAEIWNI